MSRVLKTLAIVGLVSVVLSSAQGVAVRGQGAPSLPWMDPSLSPEQRADLLIAKMTLEQKVEQLSNDVRPAMDPANRPAGCEFYIVGRHIQGIPELGIPTVRMTNGGNGVRGGDCLPDPVATGVPSTPATASTFDPDLARQLGDVLGNEARLWGHQVLLGPSMNLIRHPYGGRNYEYQSEDPYLAGVIAAATIEGIQGQGIQAVAKHDAGNEQETMRTTGESVIAPRALHELYLLPFEMSVKDAQVASVMCSYNRLDGLSACSNPDLLSTTLRQRWGFQGWVTSDRRSIHDLASITAGVDWELANRTPLHYTLEPQPQAEKNNPGSEGIRAALDAGTITIGNIDQMLRRRYIQMFKLGQFDTNFDALFGATPNLIAHGVAAREIAQQGIVLLKNENSFLPLNAAALHSVALIGSTWYAGMAKLAPQNLKANNTTVRAPYTVTPQQGLENVLRSLGSTAPVRYESGGGTGTKADREKAVDLARKSDVVIVMVGDNAHEACDRDTLRLPVIPPADPSFCGWDELKPGEYKLPTPPRGNGTDQEALMKDLTTDAAIARKMVVVLKTEGMVLMPWLDKIPALLEAWYPGQDDGTVVANVLFGLRNPSGKLPMTFGNSAREAAYATPEQFPGVWSPPPFWSTDHKETLSPQYSEELQVGYRWYEANNVKPLFPFGYGLSYTTFAYSGLTVTPTLDTQTGRAVLTVTYTIANTGTREGAEASQVYLTLPAAAGQPSKRLVGFSKVDLMPGESRQVTVTIDSSASNHPFSYWVPISNAATPGWALGDWSTAPGDYTVHVGTSSADTPLQQTVTIQFSTASPSTRAAGNFSGTGATDIAVWRPDSGTWYILTASSNYAQSVSYQWGAGSLGDRPVAADFDGDGITDLAVWRESSGTWFIKTSSSSFTQSFALQWGLPTDLPVAGDFDGDGKADPAVWRPSNATWYVLTSSSSYQSSLAIQWGSSPQNDVPVPGDFDGDGRTDLAVWRGNFGTWYILTSSSNYTSSFSVQSGELRDVPMAGDFDGDGRADLALWRPDSGNWLIKASSSNYESSFTVQWGAGSLGDVPVLGDFDKDGRTDIAVWRPGDGTWFIKTSSSGYASSFTLQWGFGSMRDNPIGGVSRPAGVPPLPPELLLVDRSHLAQVRASLQRGEPQFKPALAALEREAAGDLKVPPGSVMEKSVTPPSGDKHDYMSQAPYWWPDPSKPGGKPYIRKDGQRNPAIDRITDSAILDRIAAAVPTLGLAYYLTGKEPYAQHAAELVRTWFLDPATRMNPNLQFGQGIPGRSQGQPSGIVETRLLPNIIGGVMALQGSASWTASDDQGLRNWMAAYLQWLLDSPLGRADATNGNNQETWYDVQVVGLALYTGQTDVARQTLEAARASLGKQFEPDGRQPRELARTRAWNYSVFNLTAFVDLATYGERVGVDLWNYSTKDGRSLRKGLDFLVPFATGEKPFPYKQITPMRPSLLIPVLRRAATGFKDPKYAEIAQRLGGGPRALSLTLP